MKSSDTTKKFSEHKKFSVATEQPNLVKRFIVILLMLLAFEIVFRIFNVENFRDEALIDDDYLGHVVRPNLDITIYNADRLRVHVTTMNYKGIGLRSDNIQNPYAITIGDSHTFGLAVNGSDIWVKILEKRLDKGITNMGVGSYGTIQEERMLEKYGLELKPKIILWQFSPNDYLESYQFEYRNLSLNYFNLKQFLINNVAIAKFLWSKLGQIKHDMAVVEYNDTNLSFVFEPYSFLNNAVATDEIKIGEKLAKKALTRTKELTDSNNVKLIIILIPSKEEIYFNLTNNYQMNSMRSFCVELNLDCIDMAKNFLAQAKMHKQLYFRQDAHLNRLGNEVVADTLYHYILDNQKE